MRRCAAVWKFLENKALSDKGCQYKGGFSFLNMAKRVQGGSEGGAALVVVNQVNEACKVIEDSLANLMEGAYGCNSLAIGPKQGEAQSAKSGTVRKEVNVGGPTSGSKGEKLSLRCGKEGSVTMSSATPQRTREDGDHRNVSKTQECDSDVNPCHAIRRRSEGEGSSSGSSNSQSSGSVKWCKTTNGEETNGEHEALSNGVVGCKSSPEFRRLQSTRGHGTQTAQPKWRSNGGVGSLHHGVNSSSRLSHYSVAESSTDIHHCNDRFKLEIKDAESVRIWELGRNLGMECSGGEGNLVGELDRLEVRDKEDKEVSRVGSVKELP